MKTIRWGWFWCFVAMGLMAQAVNGADLIKAPETMVKYKLSNLRTERGIGGKVILFDYKKTRDGQGAVRLAARSDQGSIRISGLPMVIKDSGTIELQDRMEAFRGIFNRGEGGDGIEFYFVVDDSGFQLSTPLLDFGGPNRKRYLVSNSVRFGNLNTKLAARSLTREELEQIERHRKASKPPETVPAGHTRCTPSTKLVPGAPILVGLGGEWKPGTVVSTPPGTRVKLHLDGRPNVLSMSRSGWLAISNATAQKIASDPTQFSTDIRTLPDGSVILKDGIQPLDDPSMLVKGTPLLIEKHSRLVDAFFLSADNVSAQVVTQFAGRDQREIVKFGLIAVRSEILEELQNKAAAEKKFATNVSNLKLNGMGMANSRFPGSSGSMSSSGGMTSPGNSTSRSNSGSMQRQAAFPTASAGFNDSAPRIAPSAVTSGIESEPEPMRTWSDRSGKFDVTAQWTRQTDKEVFLKRNDGRVIKVPVSALSDLDQEYLVERAKPKSNEPANPFGNVVDDPSGNQSASAMRPGAGTSPAGPVNYRSPFTPVTTVNDLRWGAKSVAISPDNRFLLIGRAAESASLCELPTGKVLIDSGRMSHMGNVTACGFTPRGDYAVLGGAKGVFDIYKFSDDGEMELSKQFAAHERGISSLAFSADGKFALSGGEDKQARYWSVESGEALATITGFAGKVKATCIAPTGMLLATDGELLKVFDPNKNEVVREVKVGKSWASGQAAAFSPNGLLLVAGDGYDFRLWNLQEFAEMPTIKGNEISWSIVFAPDSQHFMSGNNGVVNVWDAKSQSRVYSHTVGSSFYIHGIGVSPDGSFISCPSAHRSVTVVKASHE